MVWLFCSIRSILKVPNFEFEMRSVRGFLQPSSPLWEQVSSKWRGSNAGSHFALSCRVSLASYSLSQLFTILFHLSCTTLILLPSYFADSFSIWVSLMYSQYYIADIYFYQKYHRSDVLPISGHHKRGIR